MYLSVLVILCLWVGGESLDNGELSFLNGSLSRTECWALGNYLAQKSWDPVAASAELAKVGGRTGNFECHSALAYWSRDLLPVTMKKLNKDDSYGDDLLQRGLRLVGRPELFIAIKAMRIDEVTQAGDDLYPAEIEQNSLSEVGGRAIVLDINFKNGWITENMKASTESQKTVSNFQASSVDNGEKLIMMSRNRGSDTSDAPSLPEPIFQKASTTKRVLKGVFVGVLLLVATVLLVGGMCLCFKNCFGFPGIQNDEIPIHSSPTSAIDMETLQRKDGTASETCTATPSDRDHNANESKNSLPHSTRIP